MSVVRCARDLLGMTQQEFAYHLTDALGKNVTQSRVAEWETGVKSPRANVREACREDAANWAITEIENITRLSLTEELTEEQADKIIALIVECQS